MPEITPENRVEQLLSWYDRHRRDLPWRASPGTRADPYKVWLSEIMLQQTTVAAVKDYFHKFVANWPTVSDLAAAELDEVLRNWAGLGYYARARNLHKCAGIVAGELGGVFPDTEAELLKLPGIGPYTAAAIAAIAFDRPAAAVDGNVERVMARLFAIETPLPDAKPEIREKTLQLVPQTRPGDFAQAVMDLGATICTPKRANCLICPWHGGCAAHRLGIAERLPVKRAKAERPTRYGVAFWVENGAGAVLLRRRPEKGLLGGMMEVPSTQWAGQLPPRPQDEAPVDTDWTPTARTVEHTFTHFHLKLEIWRGTVSNSGGLAVNGDTRWVEASQLAVYGLPSVMRKVVTQMVPADTLKPHSSTAIRR